ITLPMENAVRVAEDAAVLDALSDGRLEIGLGSGGNPTSFPAFGTSFDERREVFADRLATLRTLVSGGSLPTDHLLYPEAGTANPDRPGLDRRLWQATFSSGGAGAAGAAGDGLMLSRTQPRPQDDPGAALDDVQLPVIDDYLPQLPDHLLYREAGTANPDRPGLDRRLWQATFSSGGAGAAGAAGDGLMLSRTQPRPQDDPGAALDEVQLPVIDTYLSQLPDDVAPRILASRTAVVADAADLPRLREITEPALRNEADR